MTVFLKLRCSGCNAVTQVGPLRKRFHGSRAVVDDPAALTPEGWVMWDPYTCCTYCPSCWASIESGEAS